MILPEVAGSGGTAFCSSSMVMRVLHSCDAGGQAQQPGASIAHPLPASSSQLSDASIMIPALRAP